LAEALPAPEHRFQGGACGCRLSSERATEETFGILPRCWQRQRRAPSDPQLRLLSARAHPCARLPSRRWV